jgi:hypothetical protein
MFVKELTWNKRLIPGFSVVAPSVSDQKPNNDKLSSGDCIVTKNLFSGKTSLKKIPDRIICLKT